MPNKASRGVAPLSHLDRRVFMTTLGAAFVSGCTSTLPNNTTQVSGYAASDLAYYQAMYAAMPSARFPIPAVDVRKVDPRFLRQAVDYPGPEKAGTIVVDPAARFLYLVRGNGKALRYGVGVGRAGFGWSGSARVGRKAKWPTWTPPAAMIEREPKLAKYADGMEPGLGNPLGARALYLYQDGRDTLYRIHGTNEPWSIGKALSSGCIRLFNQDIIDLYNRVPVGAPVTVRATSKALQA